MFRKFEKFRVDGLGCLGCLGFRGSGCLEFRGLGCKKPPSIRGSFGVKSSSTLNPKALP